MAVHDDSAFSRNRAHFSCDGQAPTRSLKRREKLFRGNGGDIILLCQHLWLRIVFGHKPLSTPKLSLPRGRTRGPHTLLLPMVDVEFSCANKQTQGSPQQPFEHYSSR